VRSRPMPCTSVHEVHVICLFHGRRGRASRPSAGGAAHAFGGSEVWPSFIIWRWAGPVLDGWIRCRWRTSRLQRPLPHPRRSTTITSLRPDPSRPVRGRRPRRRRLPGSRPRNPAREPPKRAPGKREDRRSVRLARAPERVRRLLVRPVGQPSVRLARAPGKVRRLLVRPGGQPSVRLERAPERAASRLSREPPVGPGPRRS
jgi:hypothetical protein